MLISRAHVSTPLAARCLTRLCRHWSHKFTVSFNETQGDIFSTRPVACWKSMRAACSSAFRRLIWRNWMSWSLWWLFTRIYDSVRSSILVETLRVICICRY